ncbi:MAG: hypothetical protein CL797_08780 [Chromatiales bacterium]|nr:hypothetical protein [Chromatiales bacterium]
MAALILWGVGHAISRYCRITANINLLAIGIGLSAVITVGGLLNALQLAYAPALWTMTILGAVITTLELRRVRFGAASLRVMPVMVIAVALLITAAVLFTTMTQVPPRAFNHFDDLQKYFSYPVRMLATGTLSGSPLNSLGHSMLGGLAFLQAFVLSLLPIQYISVVDGVFGLAVLLAISAVIGWRMAPGSIMVFAIPLTILLIEPQSINTSSVYLPCILMLTAFMLIKDHNSRASPILLGVVYTSLVTIKATFALFVVVHFLLAFIAVFIAVRAWRQSVFWVLRVVLGACAAVLPWLITFRQEFMLWGVNPQTETLSGAGPLPNLLSTTPLYWGASYAAYSLIAAVCALSAILCLRKAFDRSDENQNILLAAFAAAASGPFRFPHE